MLYEVGCLRFLSTGLSGVFAVRCSEQRRRLVERGRCSALRALD